VLSATALSFIAFITKTFLWVTAMLELDRNGVPVEGKTLQIFRLAQPH
jgi:hypothetical protein